MMEERGREKGKKKKGGGGKKMQELIKSIEWTVR